VELPAGSAQGPAGKPDAPELLPSLSGAGVPLPRTVAAVTFVTTAYVPFIVAFVYGAFAFILILEAE
jgi:hypothetical protein